MILGKKQSLVIICLTAFCSTSLFISCKKNDTVVPTTDGIAALLNLPEMPFNYAAQQLPAYLNTPPIAGQINTPGNNPITDWGATLGRVLFYDNLLSINKTISCASCHKQANGFSDPAVLSKGFNNGLTGRHSMGLANAMYYPNGRFFWDQRANTLEAQTLMPIQDGVEMGLTLDTLVNRVRNTSYYPTLFTKAFGDNVITTNRIANALAQFIRSMVSYRSKYDTGRSAYPTAPAPAPNQAFTNFTAQENRGKELFLSPQNACAACHGSETFTAPTARNNGLDLTTTDRGFGAVINNTNNDGEFKVPSLKNIAVTAPFMHDGRFATLEQVVEHYSTGVQAHPNLSPQLVLPNGQPRRLNLSVADKAALVAFLRTLTDTGLNTDVKFSNPFK
jgi:cytochrome c peroxidase